ncbi:hypothetical protein FGRMN_9236 [Fusarium graminum]|nr:hypothetical protein FGRMN_9236 [Fusarium graminum]
MCLNPGRSSRLLRWLKRLLYLSWKQDFTLSDWPYGSHVGFAAKGVDIVLIGADLIGRTGAVSNEVSSLPAVLTAKYASLAVTVATVAEKANVMPFLVWGQEENSPQDEMQAWGELSSSVKEGPHPQIKVQNIYFEWVSSDLINHFIAEDGVTDSEGISGYAEGIEQKPGQYFANP